MGDYSRPLSLNRWIYVEGNPINRWDPTGNCYIDDQSNVCVPFDKYQDPPKISGYNEKIPPKNVSWYPSTDPLANGASGIPRNTNAAQFLNSSYEFCNGKNCVHFGLCGEGVLSAITGLSVQSIAHIYMAFKMV